MEKWLRGKILILVILVSLVFGSLAVAAVEDLGLAHQRLIDLGLQFAPHTDVGNFDPPIVTSSFNLSRWNETNFTTIDFIDRIHPGGQVTPPTGLPLDNSLPWSRVLAFVPGTNVVLNPAELPFLSSLTRLQIGDEQLLGVQLNLDTIEGQID